MAKGKPTTHFSGKTQRAGSGVKSDRRTTSRTATPAQTTIGKAAFGPGIAGFFGGAGRQKRRGI